ncbi:MAG: hypothetical protein IJ002_00045 [Clostridia bacterium]|nr:hypothetical protein [Clostridia bacterium]
MKKYETPFAKVIEFEPVDIIATSDTPEWLDIWGSLIGNVDSKSETAETLDFYNQ